MAEITNKAWEEFVDWCQSRGLQAVPANPWTLAAFIRSREDHESLKAIEKLVDGINKIHAAKTRKRLDHDPLVLRTMEMIENRHNARRQDAELFEDGDFLAKKPPGKKPSGKKPQKPKKVTKTKRAKETESSKPKSRSVLGNAPRLVTRRRLKE